MPDVFGGFQPDTKSESSRRADFDLLRRIALLERNGGGGGGSDVNEVAIGPTEPTDPAVELWYDTDEPSLSLQPLVGLESAKPTAPPSPTRYFATDTKRDWLWDGTGWIVMAEPLQTYVPAVTNISNGGGFSLTGVYRRDDGWCDVTVVHRLGTSSAGVITAAGPTWTAPFAADAGDVASPMVGNGSFYDASGPVYLLIPLLLTTTRIEPRVSAVFSTSYAGSLAQINNTLPTLVQVNDYITIRARYRMASRYT